MLAKIVIVVVIVIVMIVISDMDEYVVNVLYLG